MATKNDNEEGLLDGAGRSRRFVNSDETSANFPSAKHKKTPFLNDKKSKRQLPTDYSTREGTIRDELTVAEQLRIAAGFQQAIVKVTSYGKGAKSIFKHLAYISRAFGLPLEDANQSRIQSREEAWDLLDSWRAMYFDGRKNARDSVHLVFSAPPATCRATFKQVTREFLNEEYGEEHDYLFVQHDDTAHPHLHAVICLRAMSGEKLDPRKQYLHALRKRFAGKCREHGILLDASRRFERAIAGKSAKPQLVQMRYKRQVIPQVDKQLLARVNQEVTSVVPPVDTGEGVRAARNQRIRKQFYTTAKALFEKYQSAPHDVRAEKDIQAAKLLLDYSQSMPKERTRADVLKERLKEKLLPTERMHPDFLTLESVSRPLRAQGKPVDKELGEE